MKRKVFIVIIAEDGSLKTKEKFQKIANENNITVFIYGDIDSKAFMSGF